MGKLTKLPVPENGQPTPAPASPPASREVFAFISEHFLLVSAIAIIVGVAAATTGLGAYLRVFDWRLVWIIEYPDVLKWGLVMLALMSAFAVFGWSIIDDAIVWVTKSTWGGAKGAFVIWCVSLGALLLWDYLSPEPHHYSMLFFVHLSFFMLALVAVNITLTVERGFQVRHVLADVFFVIFTAVVIGTTIGYAVRDGEGFKHHVTTKDGPQFRSVGLVMMTSRYVVLWDRDHTVIVPAGDVTKIEGQPKAGRS